LNQMSCDRSGFTQSTDEFFFTASNQIVNDLRQPAGHRNTRQGCRPRNLPRPRTAKTEVRTPEEIQEFKKSQTGRPYSAPADCRPEFCYHSLQKDRSTNITRTLCLQIVAPSVRDFSDPQFRRLVQNTRSGCRTQVPASEKITVRH
jgi:hypothetical protein